jgi:hypothetical protein
MPSKQNRTLLKELNRLARVALVDDTVYHTPLRFAKSGFSNGCFFSLKQSARTPGTPIPRYCRAPLSRTSDAKPVLPCNATWSDELSTPFFKSTHFDTAFPRTQLSGSFLHGTYRIAPSTYKSLFDSTLKHVRSSLRSKYELPDKLPHHL